MSYSNLLVNLQPTVSCPAHAALLAADAIGLARASWASEIADVLLTVILSPSNSQRSRQTSITALDLLGQQLDVHVGVWLAPVLQNMSPPLMARRIIPVRVSGCSDDVTHDTALDIPSGHCSGHKAASTAVHAPSARMCRQQHIGYIERFN